MTFLILGVLLWIAAHFLKRLAPGLRGALPSGGPDRGIMALLIVASVILMIIGYRGAEVSPVFDVPGWAKPVNNLLMIVSVLFFGMAGSKGRLGTKFRHPMLIGFTIWAVAHLLANGDLASLILFGGLGLWSVASIFLINAQDGPWDRPEPGPASGDIKLFIITAVVFTVISTVHYFIGPSPFGA